MDACVLFAAICWAWQSRNNEVLSGTMLGDVWLFRNISCDVDVIKSSRELINGVCREPHWVSGFGPRMVL